MNQTKQLSFEQNNYFAEIIESSLDSSLAQSWQWNVFPKFGTLVQIENKKIITLGIVTQIQTGSMDPTRYPFPYQKTEEELLEQQPQIFEFLKTTFKIQNVGYIDKPEESIINKKNKCFYLLPPTPCNIHAFVKNCPLKIVSSFFDNPDFLNLLFAFSNQLTNLDELLLAIIKQLNCLNLLSNKKLSQLCQVFSLLTGNDYRRLKLFLKRIESF